MMQSERRRAASSWARDRGGRAGVYRTHDGSQGTGATISAVTSPLATSCSTRVATNDPCVGLTGLGNSVVTVSSGAASYTLRIASAVGEYDKCAARPSAQRHVVHVPVNRGANGPCAAGLYVMTRGLANGPVLILCRYDLDDAIRDARRIVRREQKSGLRITDQFAMAADIGRNDDPPFGHGFKRFERCDQIRKPHSAPRVDEEIDKVVIAPHFAMRDASHEAYRPTKIISAIFAFKFASSGPPPASSRTASGLAVRFWATQKAADRPLRNDRTNR